MKHLNNYVNLGRQCQILLPLIILSFSFLNVSAQAHFDFGFSFNKFQLCNGERLTVTPKINYAKSPDAASFVKIEYYWDGHLICMEDKSPFGLNYQLADQSIGTHTLKVAVYATGASLPVYGPFDFKYSVTILGSPDKINGESTSSQLEENASQGDAKAQHNLAVKYLNERNYEKAFYWEQKAAEQGIGSAQCNLGLMYEMGWGTNVDDSTAVSWYLKAIENGSSDAYLNIASLYIKNHNYEIAIPYLKIISEKGDIDAQSMLGSSYSHIGDYDSSIFWRNKAVEGGSVSAIFNYGIAYMKGYLGDIDYEKAIYWFERASERGHKLAPHNLSLAHYEAGKKAYEKNEWNTAFKHFLIAATSENNPISDAMRLISACYRYGRGTDVNVNLASSWMQKAADNNNPQALELLGEGM